MEKTKNSGTMGFVVLPDLSFLENDQYNQIDPITRKVQFLRAWLDEVSLGGNEDQVIERAKLEFNKRVSRALSNIPGVWD